MTEHYSMFIVAWMFFILIGGWVLVNALIDLGARRVRRWLSDRMDGQTAIANGISMDQRDTR